MKINLYLCVLMLAFSAGWEMGLANYGWSKWIVAPIVAFICGAIIRMFWMKP